MYGPLFIIATDSFISRGLHGPWYYEKKYVDNILMKKKEVLNTYNNDEKVRDNSNLKYIRIIIGGFVLTILVIIYGILNMKLLEKKSIEKDE